MNAKHTFAARESNNEFSGRAPVPSGDQQSKVPHRVQRISVQPCCSWNYSSCKVGRHKGKNSGICRLVKSNYFSNILGLKCNFYEMFPIALIGAEDVHRNVMNIVIYCLQWKPLGKR